METLLKRHFWAINLAALAAIAYFAAGSVNALIGLQLSKASRPDDKSQVVASADESPLTKKLRDGRLREESGAVMAGRRPFWQEEPAPPEPPPEELPPEGAGGPETPPEPSFDPTTLPIKLLGTMVVAPETWSSASVEVERTSQKIVNVGMELLGGQATVYAIRRNYLVLKEGDKLTVAKLFADEAQQAAGGAPLAPGAAVPVPGAGRAPGAPVRPTPAAMAGGVDPPGVKKVGDGVYNLERGNVNEKLKDVTTLGTQVRIVPNYRGGKYEGFRMIGMGGGSLFSDIGFLNGDIVQAINGERIDSPNKALALYEALKNKARLTVLIERDGQPKTLRYTIR
jgi:general secretion pathway protein C